MWHDDEELRNTVILDPVRYFVTPATRVVCKHVPTEGDATKHSTESHRILRKRYPSDFTTMTDEGIISERLLKGFLDWDDGDDSNLTEYEETSNYVQLRHLMIKYGLIVPLDASVEDESEKRDGFMALEDGKYSLIMFKMYNKIEYLQS